ncbi:MAG: MFS transporter [Gammaproteobacteria bacterium]|jgi:MFS family permease|nr:MFS transporter [Gammaproteobacteria bacterium]
MNGRLPSSAYAWYTTILLTVVYVFSFIDRYILGLLVEPIKLDLGLSDTEIGLLLGPAFALLYTTMGLPIGWLADRWRRTWIVAIGVVLWSLATAMCGLARNFGQLFLARISVGVGEATLAPCALPMIADSFPPEKRGKPVAFYSAALSLGAGIASLAGASVLIWSKSAGQLSLPGVGDLEAWQFAFIAVGAPGVLLGILMFFLREPERQEQVGLTAGGKPGLRVAASYLWADKQFFAGFVAIVCVMTIVAYSQGWLPAMFARTWGWPAEKYALFNGIMMLAVGPLTVNTTGWYIDRLQQQGRSDAPVRMMIVGTLILIPSGIAAPLMPTGEIAFGLFAVNLVGIAMISAAAPTALLNVTAGEIRSQVTAIYFLVIGVTGLMLGPTAIGVLNDVAFGIDGARYSVALVPAAFGLPLLFTLRATLRRYRERVTRLQVAPD